MNRVPEGFQFPRGHYDSDDPAFSAISKITENLFISGQDAAESIPKLKDAGISHVVNISDNCTPFTPAMEILNIKYLTIPNISDVPTVAMAETFLGEVPMAHDFIHQAILKNKKVLIHCVGGVSRSATLAVTYLRTVSKFDIQRILAHVQEKRTVCEPNEKFMQMCQTFERSNLYMLERRRMNISEEYVNGNSSMVFKF